VGISHFIVPLHEVLTVQPPIVSDKLKDTQARRREAASSQVGIVLGSGVNWGGSFFIPDFGSPVTHCEEEFLLLAVL